MTTYFDPDSGVLRVRHAALAVLARLATDPADTRLHDHDVAPLVAELRGAGLLGPGGIHPDVVPLAATIGAATTTADLIARDHGTVRRMRAWAGADLVVVGLESGDDAHSYDLMADTRPAAVALLAEAVGLHIAPEPPVAGTRRVEAATFGRLVEADSGVSAEDVAAALASEADDPWAAALTDGLRGSALRWRLTASRDDASLLDIEVLDAGRSGLWLAERHGDEVEISAARPGDVRARLGQLMP